MEEAIQLIKNSQKILVIQAENPDGDSLGSSVALEEILSDMGKKVSLYCPVEIPKYMHYIKGWDRVDSVIDFNADLIIIVDTSAEILLSRVLETPGARHYLDTTPTLVIDHHVTESNLTFNHSILVEEAIATAEIIYKLAKIMQAKINPSAAESLLIAIMSDSLGFSIQGVNAGTFKIASELIELGASSYEIEQRRREYMKKSAEILKYKGELIERIEYFLDGKLALIRIPFEDIQAYSDQYNPSVLVLDEMRLVEGVEIGIAIKTYPDGKLTGKIRTNLPIAAEVAGYFGGGGHEYAAGFRVYDDIEAVIPEIITSVSKALGDK